MYTASNVYTAAASFHRRLRFPEIKGWEQRPRQTEDLAVFTSWKLPARACSKVCLSLYSSTSGLWAQEQLLPGPERMARATRYLYNKPGDNVRVRGTTPPRTLRGMKPINQQEGQRGEREREREREKARGNFLASTRSRGDRRLWRGT